MAEARPFTRHGGHQVETVHNYYEGRVFQELERQLKDEGADGDFLADVACVALNHLPPRYIRHDVDMAFYLSPHERREITQKVEEAVRLAIEFVAGRGRAS